MPKSKVRPPDFKVPRAALMTWAFAHKGPNSDKYQYEIRENLQTVHFESSIEGARKDGIRKLHALATDGHRLLHVWWTALPTDVLEEGFEIEASAVDLFLRDLNQEKGSVLSRGKGHDFRIRTEGPNYVIIAEDDDQPVAWVEAGLIEHNRLPFPEWRKVVPKWKEGETKYPTTLGVDFEYVIDFHRFLKEFGHGTQMKICCPSVETESAMIFAPTVPSEEGEFEVDFLLLDQATAVEYILMPVKLS